MFQHLLAARFLGQHVGSTAPLFLAFLAVHVVAGTTAVITGVTAALAHKLAIIRSMVPLWSSISLFKSNGRGRIG